MTWVVEVEGTKGRGPVREPIPRICASPIRGAYGAPVDLHVSLVGRKDLTGQIYAQIRQAILDGHLDDAGSLGVIVSGGNIDPMLLQHVIVNELAHSDRYLSVAVEVRDRPGELSRIIQLVAEQGANLVDIGHQRTPRGLPMGSAAVALTVETRGRAQQAGVLRALASAGYDVADSAAT